MKNITILFFVVSALFALSFFIYYPSFSAPFQLDDYGVFVNNPVMHQVKHLEWIWRYDPSRFITHSSFALNAALHGLVPEYFHLVNYLIHMLNTFLAFSFVARVLDYLKAQGEFQGRSRWVALLAAVFFMIHPLQTSTVTYIAQRATLLAAFFYFSAMFLYFLGRVEKKPAYYLLSLAAVLAGVFCKPVIVTLPLALLVMEITLFKAEDLFRQKGIFRLLPYIAVVSLVPVLLSLWFFRSGKLADALRMTSLTDLMTRGEYLMTQFNVLVKYLGLYVVPVGQNLDYDFPIARDFFLWPTWFSFCLLTALLVFAATAIKRQKITAFCILFFFAALSVESSIFPLPDVIFEHRTYIPLLALSTLLAYGCEKFLRTSQWQRAVIVLIILYFSTLTLQRNLIWSQKFTLLEDVAAKSPGKARVHNSLGLAYAQDKSYDKALTAFDQAIHLAPYYLQAYNNRATAYRLTGNFTLALADYDRVLSLDPNFPMAYYFRGQTHQALGHSQQALKDYQQARQLGFPVSDDLIDSLINKNR